MYGFDLIRCVCRNQTPDGMFNLACSGCGHYVHGICYQVKSGPVTCVQCLGSHTEQTKEMDFKALAKRLTFSLSQGEHRNFFGDMPSNSVASVFLELRFNMKPEDVKQLINISIQNEVLILLSEGDLQYNVNSQSEFDADEQYIEKESDNISQLMKFETKDLNGYSSCKQEFNSIKCDPDISLAEKCEEDEDIQLKDSLDQLDIVQTNDADLDEAEIKIETDVTEENFEVDEEYLENSPKPIKKKKRGPVKCEDCEFVGADRTVVRRHVERVHLNIRHKCPFCDLQSTRKLHLKQHILSVHEGKKYDCEECGASFSSPGSMKLHIKQVHQGKRYKCEQCDKDYCQLGPLKLHIRRDHEGVVYMCDQCPHQATSKQGLNIHKEKKHPTIKEDHNSNNSFEAENGQLESDLSIKEEKDSDIKMNTKAMRSKVRSTAVKKKPGKPMQCQDCDFVGADYTSVRRHRDRVHLNIRYPCPHCDHQSARKSDLKQHVLSIHEGKRYQCDQCEASLSNPNSLKAHIKILHEGKRYYCDQCNKEFSQSGALNTHIKHVHEGVVYMCDQCPHQASSKGYLKRHKKDKHSGIKHLCDLCTYQAPTAQCLRLHKNRDHLGIRYKCDICQYSATTSSALKAHKEVKHEGKVYPCTQCNYSSSFKYKTSQHILTQHEGVRYHCEHCTFQTAHAGDVLKHKKKAHKELFPP